MNKQVKSICYDIIYIKDNKKTSISCTKYSLQKMREAIKNKNGKIIDIVLRENKRQNKKED